MRCGFAVAADSPVVEGPIEIAWPGRFRNSKPSRFSFRSSCKESTCPNHTLSNFDLQNRKTDECPTLKSTTKVQTPKPSFLSFQLSFLSMSFSSLAPRAT